MVTTCTTGRSNCTDTIVLEEISLSLTHSLTILTACAQHFLLFTPQIKWSSARGMHVTNTLTITNFDNTCTQHAIRYT